jgi:hypothetical protein
LAGASGGRNGSEVEPTRIVTVTGFLTSNLHHCLEDVMALALNLPNLFKFPDDVKVVLEATFVTTVESESRRDLQNRRILAIVSHKDEWDLTEEGA